jgi:hypothetical protein
MVEQKFVDLTKAYKAYVAFSIYGNGQFDGR